MATGDDGDEGLGAAQARAERMRERRLHQLKDDVFRACQALREAGLSEARIAARAARQGMPLSRSVVAKLTSDSDEQGWRIPSLRTCLAIDAVCREMNLAVGLAERRQALDLAARELRAAKARDQRADSSRNLSYAQRAALEGELRDYLAVLGRVLARTPTWLPYRRLDSGFAERLVKVSDEAPDPAPDGGLYREAPPPGTVRWERAIEGVPIAVVLADAGYGKTWQLRRHCLRLCQRALAALDSDRPISEVRVPLWVPAGDLARCWPGGGGPAAAVAEAAGGELRRSGSTISAELTDFLAAALTAGSVTVLIDAYDEVFDDQLRSSVRQALGWLTEGQRREKSRLILASRQAGYDQPFDLRGDPGDPEEEDVEPGDRPYYVHLGLLAESQVQALWADWFAARRLPVPDERLQPAVTPNSPLRRFVGIPLVAAFCAWVADVEPVASTRTGLYGQVLRRFLGQAWKSDAPVAGSARQDGARRALLEEALIELAWLMATEQGRWRDSVDVGRCEQIIAASGPAAPPGFSHTWELVRQIGILVQEGSERILGDGPVLWIHRSVQQFLTARKLVALGPGAVPHVENAWLHPAWGDVLDFAIGMETGQEEEAVTRAVRAAAVGDDDALGWYAGVFAAASAGLPAAPAVRGAVVERVWRLHRAGLLSPTHLARVLALVAEASSEAVVLALRERLNDPDTDTDRSESWRAMAWSGAPGRALLARLIRESPAAIGAAAALQAVDPAAAVAALRDRVAGDLPVGAPDAPVLRELDPAAVTLLAERYEADPESEERAHWLGLTGHRLARRMLSDPQRLQDLSAQIRYAAAYGLVGAYGTDIDEAGLRVLLDVALHDPVPELRRRIRGRLQDIAAEVPWVEAALDDVFDQLYADPTQPEITDRESLAPFLQQVGPATHKAVAMLIVEPALIDGPVLEPLLALTERALRGELDQSLTADVARAVAARFGARTFTEPACAMLRRADEAPAAAGRLAVGLAWAAPGDPEIFDALVVCAGGSPHSLTSAALHVYDLPVALKCDALGRSLLGLTNARPRAVEIWSRALRSLLQQAPQRQRQQSRALCAAATTHLLQLSGEA